MGSDTPAAADGTEKLVTEKGFCVLVLSVDAAPVIRQITWDPAGVSGCKRGSFPSAIAADALQQRRRVSMR